MSLVPFGGALALVAGTVSVLLIFRDLPRPQGPRPPAPIDPQANPLWARQGIGVLFAGFAGGTTVLGLVSIVLWATLVTPDMASAVPAAVIALAGLSMTLGVLGVLAAWRRYAEAAPTSPDLARLGGRALVRASVAQGVAMLGFVVLAVAVFFTR